MKDTYLWKVVIRGLLLRCPRCGRGKLYKGIYTMYSRCSHCGWVFEREEGYWTGAIAVNLVVTEFFAAAIVIPLAAMQTPPLLLYGLGLPLMVLIPLLFYRHAKSLWMSMDFILHPTELR
ncbi:MAG TPA: DUF983 domain-containing protein [Ktedonobacterales bacterium]|nr:DUF983 domain-containing protein [Ktedonobacterales bacterium]